MKYYKIIDMLKKYFLLIILINFVFLFSGVVLSFTRQNVDIQYFERYLYNLGRIESIN